MILKGLMFFKLMNNAVLGRNMENVSNRLDIKPVITDKKKYVGVKSSLPYNKILFGKLLAVEIKKINAKKNKPLYLGP